MQELAVAGNMSPRTTAHRMIIIEIMNKAPIII